ncbi:hypothetical protein FGO68_gene13473 [Halteria grandinella]|uniref:Uncharacterized protein n=1 Tax=Halteria grandinella TaxID=5974 RepID=A0A8J8NFK9_HALGN|nr:hypothetical protein FGO68_gene13473 [Halteria grandinella]
MAIQIFNGVELPQYSKQPDQRIFGKQKNYHGIELSNSDIHYDQETIKKESYGASCPRIGNQYKSLELTQNLFAPAKHQPNIYQTDSKVFAKILNKIDYLKTLGVLGPIKLPKLSKQSRQSIVNSRKNERDIQSQTRDKPRHLEIIQSVTEYSSEGSQIELKEQIEVSKKSKEPECDVEECIKYHFEHSFSRQYLHFFQSQQQVQYKQYEGCQSKFTGKSQSSENYINEEQFEEGSLLDIPDEYTPEQLCTEDEESDFEQSLETEEDILSLYHIVKIYSPTHESKLECFSGRRVTRSFDQLDQYECE